MAGTTTTRIPAAAAWLWLRARTAAPPKKGHTGRNIGLGCGGLIGLVILIAIIAAIANSGGGSGNSTSASGGSSSPAVSSARIGSKVRDGDFQSVVTSVSQVKDVGDTADGLGDIDGNGTNGGGAFLNQINPGDTVTGNIYFDLPAGVSATRAMLHDSALSGGVGVSQLLSPGHDQAPTSARDTKALKLRQPKISHHTARATTRPMMKRARRWLT